MPDYSENPSNLIEDGPDVILIEELVVPAQIGILDSEKGRVQNVRFDIEIEAAPEYRKLVRETGQFISYADAVEFIRNKAESGGHTDLVEEWAETVAEFVLTNPLARRVTVSVIKPEIFKEAKGVGIRISRKRA